MFVVVIVFHDNCIQENQCGTMGYTDSNCNTLRYASDLLSSVRLRELKKRKGNLALCERLS